MLLHGIFRHPYARRKNVTQPAPGFPGSKNRSGVGQPGENATQLAPGTPPEGKSRSVAGIESDEVCPQNTLHPSGKRSRRNIGFS